MKKAKVIYNPTEDKYEIYTDMDDGNGWGFCTGYQFMASAKNPNGEKCLLSYRIITKLAELEHLGYSITFKYL